MHHLTILNIPTYSCYIYSDIIQPMKMPQQSAKNEKEINIQYS